MIEVSNSKKTSLQFKGLLHNEYHDEYDHDMGMYSK